eukprot:3928020-Pleurochrysis_carterae.AAC.1
MRTRWGAPAGMVAATMVVRAGVAASGKEGVVRCMVGASGAAHLDVGVMAVVVVAAAAAATAAALVGVGFLAEAAMETEEVVAEEGWAGVEGAAPAAEPVWEAMAVAVTKAAWDSCVVVDAIADCVPSRFVFKREYSAGSRARRFVWKGSTAQSNASSVGGVNGGNGGGASGGGSGGGGGGADGGGDVGSGRAGGGCHGGDGGNSGRGGGGAATTESSRPATQVNSSSKDGGVLATQSL